MCNIFDMPREWAEDDKQNEADAFAEAIKRIKPVDNIHTAYQRGYEAGYKAAEDRILRCMEVPTKAAAKLLNENKQLREDNQKLREALMRTTTDRYEYE
jgi:regulator of replication initiation timing